VRDLKSPLRFVNLRWAWLLLALAAAAIYPALAYNIAAVAYDAATVHIYRGFVYSDAISQGVILPHWVQPLHWGLGSPAPTFEPPLPYAGMDLLYRLGLPHTLGWQVMMALGLLAACTGAYALVYLLTKQKWPAVLAGVAYLYAPYVLRDVFERGTPEALSVYLYPWVLWSLIWLARHPSGWRMTVAAGMWALCISAHVLAPLMLAPVAGLAAVLLAWRYRTLAPLLALVVGALLVAFIWLPIVSEQNWVHVERDFAAGFANPVENAIPLDRLLALPPIYDIQNDTNGTGDTLGLVHVALLAAGLPALYLLWRRRERQQLLVLGVALLVGWALFWLLTGASDPVWRVFQSILVRLQYRSRLMGVLALANAVVAGVALTLLPRRWQPYVGGILAGLLVLLALPSLYVDLRHQYSQVGPALSLDDVRQAEIASGGTAFTSFGEFQPRWRTAPFDDKLLQQLGPHFDAQAQPLAGQPQGVKISAAQVQAGKWELDVENQQAAVMTLHLLYYPRWQARVDGQPVTLRAQAETGYAQLDAPAGKHHISLRYGSTATEQASLVVSALALGGLLVAVAWPLFSRRQRRHAASTRTEDGEDQGRDARAERAPSLWLLGGLTVALAFKVFFVDGSTTWLRCQSTATQVCGAQAAVDVPFAAGPRLQGYTVLDSSAQRGGEVRVRLIWRAEPGQTTRLSSFVHIRNSQPGGAMNPRTGSEIWAQENHLGPGGLLTTDFVPGKLYTDEFRVRLPADMPPGAYFLEVGWADSTSGEQLEPQPDAVKLPLKILWRSILLPSIQVR
jgi:hypothetical protein